MPKSRLDFWETKLERNRERDALHRAELEALGWRVVEIWECETTDGRRLKELVTERVLEGAT
jgi:DNA mismatch endonuclease (patch repair protein)